MNRVGAPNGLRTRFAETDMADLALLDQLAHCADGIFDGNFRVDTVQVVEIDVIGLQASYGRLARFRHVLRPSVDISPFCPRPRLTAEITELARQDDLAALSFERLGQQLFIVAVVMVRRIDKVDAEVDGAMNDRDIALRVGVAQLSLKRRTAKTDRRNLQARLAEKTILHGNVFLADGRVACRGAACCAPTVSVANSS